MRCAIRERETLKCGAAASAAVKLPALTATRACSFEGSMRDSRIESPQGARTEKPDK
jgi:hypothetical protein